MTKIPSLAESERMNNPHLHIGITTGSEQCIARDGVFQCTRLAGHTPDWHATRTQHHVTEHHIDDPWVVRHMWPVEREMEPPTASDAHLQPPTGTAHAASELAISSAFVDETDRALFYSEKPIISSPVDPVTADAALQHIAAIRDDSDRLTSEQEASKPLAGERLDLSGRGAFTAEDGGSTIHSPEVTRIHYAAAGELRADGENNPTHRGPRNSRVAFSWLHSIDMQKHAASESIGITLKVAADAFYSHPLRMLDTAIRVDVYMEGTDVYAQCDGGEPRRIGTVQ